MRSSIFAPADFAWKGGGGGRAGVGAGVATGAPS